MRIDAPSGTAGVLAGKLFLAALLATGCALAGANAAAPAPPAPLPEEPGSVEHRKPPPPQQQQPPEPPLEPPGLGLGRGRTSGECEFPPGLELALLFELAKGPAALPALRAAVEKVRPGAALQCGDGRRGYLLLRRDELTRLLGQAAEFSCVAGAGNIAGKSSYRARLVPPGFVPPSLSGAVVRLELEDDPKFLLAGATGYRACSRD